jgi:hypothetical protein
MVDINKVAKLVATLCHEDMAMVNGGESAFSSQLHRSWHSKLTSFKAVVTADGGITAA